MAQRMSPKKQAGARSELSASMANVTTGDASMDSLLRGDMARREKFSVLERNAKPAVAPKKKLGFFQRLFGRKK